MSELVSQNDREERKARSIAMGIMWSLGFIAGFVVGMYFF